MRWFLFCDFVAGLAYVVLTALVTSTKLSYIEPGY